MTDLNYKIVNPIDVSGKVCIEIAKNISMKIPFIKKLRAKIGRTSGEPTADNLNRYVFNLVNEVKKYCGDVSGKSILEIGPGDNLVTGLAFLALGARSYAVLDRFSGDYDSIEARRWYQLLVDNWPYGTWPKSLDHKVFPKFKNVIKYESAVESFEMKEQYDIVCSYAVGEHVSNVKDFALITKRALKENGIGMHVIDFSGHQWDKYGDPFLFLKFPDFIWNAMGSARGEPNRVRFGSFIQNFTDIGLDVEIKDVYKKKFNPDDRWVSKRVDDYFLIDQATIILRAY